MNGGEHQRDRLDGASEWGVRKTVYIYIYIYIYIYSQKATYSVQWMLFVFEKGYFIINKQKMNR